MLVPMSKVHVIGHRRRLDQTLEALHRLSLVQLIDVASDATVSLPPLTADDSQSREMEDLRFTKARLDALLSLASDVPTPDPSPVDLAVIRRELEEFGPPIEAMAQELEELETELETLPRHLRSLKRLLPLIPELTELEGYDTDAVILDARHATVLGELNSTLDELLDGNFEIISGQVDDETVGAVIVTPKQAHAELQSILGRSQVNRVRLPHRFESVPLRDAVSLMERRLTELPMEITNLQDRIDASIRARLHWVTASGRLAERMDQLGAVQRLGATPHTFVLSGWVPVPRVADVRLAVESLGEGEGEVIVEVAPTSDDDEPPVLMANRSLARPFESLVSLLSTPRYGSLDPTTLMMVFMPLFFGMMLGDIVYGVVLLAIAIVVRRRVASPAVAEFAKIFVLGAIWTVVWGVVYGELLGDLGHRVFGLEPIWINREEALQPLLVFAVAIGAAHITLGLVLGMWVAGHRHDRAGFTTSLGTLLALVGLMLVVGVAVDRLPDGLMTPAVAVVVVGTVVMISMEGPMGLLTGPLDLMGLVGNVLSYLRIAAIGIASVYLARVANELGALGPVWLGVIVATLFHALNLALGVFSPTIQSLRLHYVEFFGKFYEGDGTSFRPFGTSERKER